MHQGAVERLRPKLMTVTAIIAGLLPIMWGSGEGSEVMRRIAAPMVGGMPTSALLTLLLIPVIYALYSERLLTGTSAWFGKSLGGRPSGRHIEAPPCKLAAN